MTVEAKRIPPIHQRKREIALLLELCCAVIMGHRPKNACVTRLFAKPLKGAHYIRPETKPFAAMILSSLLIAWKPLLTFFAVIRKHGNASKTPPILPAPPVRFIASWSGASAGARQGVLDIGFTGPAWALCHSTSKAILRGQNYESKARVAASSPG